MAEWQLARWILVPAAHPTVRCRVLGTWFIILGFLQAYGCDGYCQTAEVRGTSWKHRASCRSESYLRILESRRHSGNLHGRAEGTQFKAQSFQQSTAFEGSHAEEDGTLQVIPCRIEGPALGRDREIRQGHGRYPGELEERREGIRENRGWGDGGRTQCPRRGSDRNGYLWSHGCDQREEETTSPTGAKGSIQQGNGSQVHRDPAALAGPATGNAAAAADPRRTKCVGTGGIQWRYLANHLTTAISGSFKSACIWFASIADQTSSRTLQQGQDLEDYRKSGALQQRQQGIQEQHGRQGDQRRSYRRNRIISCSHTGFHRDHGVEVATPCLHHGRPHQIPRVESTSWRPTWIHLVHKKFGSGSEEKNSLSDEAHHWHFAIGSGSSNLVVLHNFDPEGRTFYNACYKWRSFRHANTENSRFGRKVSICSGSLEVCVDDPPPQYVKAITYELNDLVDTDITGCPWRFEENHGCNRNDPTEVAGQPHRSSNIWTWGSLARCFETKARGCTLLQHDEIDAAKNSFDMWTVSSSGSSLYVFDMMRIGRSGSYLYDRRLYVRKTEGCTSRRQYESEQQHWGHAQWYHSEALLNAFRCFLMYHQLATVAITLLKLVVFVLQRILFLNYEGQSKVSLADFGWQCVRVGCIGVLCILRAILVQRARQKRLVIAGKQRFQRVQRRYQTLQWSFIWIGVMISTAHAIEVQQSICNGLSLIDQSHSVFYNSAGSSEDTANAATYDAVVLDTNISHSIWSFEADSQRYEDILRRVRPHVIDRWCVVDAQDVSRISLDGYECSHQTCVQEWDGRTHKSFGCRHDFVRRPIGLFDASLGGSYDGEYTLILYTRSQSDISRQRFWFSGIPPLWDVDAIIDRLRFDVSRTDAQLQQHLDDADKNLTRPLGYLEAFDGWSENVYPGLYLTQRSWCIIFVTGSAASYTDQFIDAVWTLTSSGERNLTAAADLDPDVLRQRWLDIGTRNGIPRPVGVSTYVIHRLPQVRIATPPFELTLARFDDPYGIPGEVEVHWPELQMATWRLYPCHSAVAQSRTWIGIPGFHFILQYGLETSSATFVAGVVEVTIASDEDEASMLFGATIPSRASWLHLWNWLRLGHGFPQNSVFSLLVNGCFYSQPHEALLLSTGFFVQISIVVEDAQDYNGIPRGKAKLMMGELCHGRPSGAGEVFRAAATRHDADQARISYDRRDEAITRRWPDLTVWTMHKLHPTGRTRGPPWKALQDAWLLHPHPDGMHVAILAALFEGGGCNEYALVLHRHGDLFAVYQALHCEFRCLDPQYLCVATVNTRPVTLGTPLHLDDGDYIEVFVSLRGSRELALYTLAQTDDAEGEEELSTPGMITDVGIDTDPRYGAESAEPQDTLEWSLMEVQHTSRCPLRLPQSVSHGRRAHFDKCADERVKGHFEVDTDHSVFMQRPAPSLAPTRVQMRLVGLHGYADRRAIDTTQPLTSQIVERWSHIRRAQQPVVDLHTVEYPPTFNAEASQPMTIVQFQDDHFEQINDDDVLAVVTIILQEPQRREKLKVHWIPHKLTRQGFVFFTRMQGFCDRLEVLCTIYHNGQIWPEEASLKRHMQYGDHLRLQIRSSCYVWSDFEFTENLERQRKLFGSSSGEEEHGEPNRESDRSDRSRPSGHRSERSRSRNRYHEYGEESESASLLQFGWSFIQPITKPKCRTRWICEKQPHVLDRWCANFHSLPTITFPRKDGFGGHDADGHVVFGCRHDVVRRPNCLEVLLFGGSSNSGLHAVEDSQWLAQGTATDVGIDTEDNSDLRSGAASAEPHDNPEWTFWKDGVVFLQRSALPLVKKSFKHDTFSELPPPGNGRRTHGPSSISDAYDNQGEGLTVIDVTQRVDLDALDDFTVSGNYLIVKQGPSGLNGRVLLLADHLPNRAVRPEQEVSIEIPDKLLHTLTMLRHGMLRSMPLRPLPDLPWHEETRRQLEIIPTSITCAGLTHISIYTDGSAGQRYDNYTYYDHAAWSFVVVGWHESNTEATKVLLTIDCGHVSGTVADYDWTGASKLNAMAGERAALTAAATWLLRSGFRGQATFHFDSTAAGFAASGLWNTTPGPNDASLLRAVFQVLLQQQELSVQFAHVKAHSGDPWNECADTLAYWAWSTHRTNSVLDFDVRTVLKDDRPLCMQWPLLGYCHDGVEHSHGYLSWYRDTAEPRAEVVWQHLPKQQEVLERHLQFRVATYNVCTIAEKKGATGIQALLRAQFAAQKLDIIGLQETRATTTQVIKAADYTRYCVAATDNGSGGTEIWIATQGALAKAIRHKHTVVLYQDPECLLLRIQVGTEPLCILSAHAPHSGRDRSDIRHWWEALCATMTRKVGQQLCVVLVDANAHFVEESFPWVGNAGLEKKSNVCAECLLDFLQRSQLFLPSTFDTIHVGQTNTWRNPARSTLHRCDYIAIPQSWSTLSLTSWVDGCLDTGRNGVDHVAVVLELKIPWRLGGKSTDWPRVRIDRRALSGASATQIEQLLAGLPKQGWAVNIHEQAASMVVNLQKALEEAFPCQRKPPKADYISDKAWKIRAQRRFYRRQLFHSESNYAYRVCMTMFYVWKHYTQGNTNAQAWHQRRVVLNADSLVLKLQIWALGRQLKAQLLQDKQDHLSRLADEAAHSSATQIYAKLRALGVCGKRKRRAITPLPMVHHDDPQVDSHDIWRQHFERLEDGVECDPAALLADCDRIQRERPTILPAVEELPTLLELEHAFRANSRGKACFFDGVPTELAHHFPQFLASHFFPLLLKQALLIAEPITFKGGLLVQAFKGHGPMNSCESYRSLMVSSIFSKSGHRILRRQAVKHMQTYKAAAQLGGLPGKAVSQAAHILTTWANWKKKEHRSTAVILSATTSTSHQARAIG